MTKILEYMRLVIIVAGVLIGIQAPGFVDQYGKALQAHYLESQNCLREFQDEADRYFDGNLQKLVEHYQKSPDPVFFEGGISIGALLERNETLAKSYRAFYEDPYSPYIQVLLDPVKDIREEVLSTYTYTIVLNKAAVFAGLLSGLAAALLLEFITGIYRIVMRQLSRKPEQSQE